MWPAARPGRPTRRPGLGPRSGPVPPGSSLCPHGFACYLCTEASRAEPQAVPGAAQEDVPGAEKGPAAARLATPSCCTDSSQGSPRRGPRGPSPRPSPRSCFNQNPRHRAKPTARDVTSGARRHGHSRGSDFQFWTPRGEELPVWGGERGAGSETRRCPDMAAPWPSRVRRGTAVGCLQGGGRSAGRTHSHAHGPSVQPGRRKAAWSAPETHPRWERNLARPPSARTLPGTPVNSPTARPGTEPDSPDSRFPAAGGRVHLPAGRPLGRAGLADSTAHKAVVCHPLRGRQPAPPCGSRLCELHIHPSLKGKSGLHTVLAHQGLGTVTPSLAAACARVWACTQPHTLRGTRTKRQVAFVKRSRSVCLKSPDGSRQAPRVCQGTCVCPEQLCVCPSALPYARAHRRPHQRAWGLGRGREGDLSGLLDLVGLSFTNASLS